MKKFCIIHPTVGSISLLKPLAASILPDAVVYNFLDESFLPEVIEANSITDAVRQRVFHLIQAAALTSPDAILVACAAVGNLADETANITDIPVKRIEEKMCMDAVNAGTTIGVAATLASALPPVCNLLNRLASQQSKTILIKECLISDANLIPEKIAALKSKCDVVVLAQPSMAQALSQIHDEGEKYLSCPESGLKQLLNT